MPDSRNISAAYSGGESSRTGGDKLAIHGNDKVSADRVKIDCTLAPQADDLTFCQKQVLILPNIAVDQLSEPRNVIVLGHILRAPILL